MTFAEALTLVQAQHGETNYRLAKEIGVTQTSIKNWKTGERRPHPKHVKLIEKHYGMKDEELYSLVRAERAAEMLAAIRAEQSARS